MEWFLGAITDEHARTFDVALSIMVVEHIEEPRGYVGVAAAGRARRGRRHGRALRAAELMVTGHRLQVTGL